MTKGEQLVNIFGCLKIFKLKNWGKRFKSEKNINEEKIIVNVFMIMQWRKPFKYHSEAKTIQLKTHRFNYIQV